MCAQAARNRHRINQPRKRRTALQPCVTALREEHRWDVLPTKALDATGAVDAARARFRRAASRVTERAARFGDPDARAAFCALVSENAQALARDAE